MKVYRGSHTKNCKNPDGDWHPEWGALISEIYVASHRLEFEDVFSERLERLRRRQETEETWAEI